VLRRDASTAHRRGARSDPRWRSRGLCRFLFFALFLWASLVNMRLALWHPTAYLEYARWAVGPYRRFILGPFSRHASLFVGAIAVGQLVIAALVAARGRAVALGLAGAIVFLLAIAPLGRGSAFPFSLVAAAAAALLLRRSFTRSLAREALAAAARLRARLHLHEHLSGGSR
jgi:hypothetical protein